MESNQVQQPFTMIHTSVRKLDGARREVVLLGPSMPQILIALLKADTFIDIILHDRGELQDCPTVLVVEVDGKLSTHVFNTMGDSEDAHAAQDLAHKFINQHLADNTLRVQITPWNACYFTADAFKD